MLCVSLSFVKYVTKKKIEKKIFRDPHNNCIESKLIIYDRSNEESVFAHFIFCFKLNTHLALTSTKYSHHLNPNTNDVDIHNYHSNICLIVSFSNVCSPHNFRWKFVIKADYVIACVKQYQEMTRKKSKSSNSLFAARCNAREEKRREEWKCVAFISTR